MVIFTNCKINIGLDVTARRADGYHDLDTLMFPIAGLCDAVEILPSAQSGLTIVGTTVDCEPEKNLCMKALRLMQRDYGAGQAHVWLQKAVPFGAGLGGGSSDAAAVIRGVNHTFGLGLGTAEMECAAGRLGSDIPFFIAGQPALASGRGEILQPADPRIMSQLAGKHLVIIKPPVSVSTVEAYAGITPHKPSKPLSERLQNDISVWPETVGNAFEAHIFIKYPQLGKLKAALYELGAVYASMSGSGSALYGIFEQAPQMDRLPKDMFIYHEFICG